MITAQMPVTVYLTNEAGVQLSGEIELTAHFFEDDFGGYELEWLETDNEERIPIRAPGNGGASDAEELLWDMVQGLLDHDTETQSRAHYAIQQEAA